MQRYTRWMTAITIATILPLAGCDKPHEESHEVRPATVEPSEDSGISRLTLTDRAAERLGIQTADVQQAANELVAPYSALLYDAAGGTWVYTSPQPHVYKRSKVEVDRIDGDRIFMSDGPPAGTKVVIVGAAELFGAEFEIGH